MANLMMPVTPIGQLRERVLLQQLAVSVDATGDPTYAWADVAIVWARVRPAGGSVATIAGRRSEVNDYDVTVRWRAGLSPAQRFVWRGRYLQIQNIANPDERHQRVTLACRDVGTGAGTTP